MVGGGMKTARKFVVVVCVDLKRGEVDADGGGIADCGSAAYLELADRCPNFALRFEVQVFGFVRELCLIDNDKRTLLLIEGESFHVKNVCGHSEPLFVKCIKASLPPLTRSPVATGETKGDEEYHGRILPNFYDSWQVNFTSV